MNALFDNARESFLNGDLSWIGDTIKAVLVSHTPDVATDRFLSDIVSGARVSTSQAFANKAVNAGVADADDITFRAVTGPIVESLVIYQDSGDPETSLLIASIDSFGTGFFPLTPNGGDVLIQWDSGSNKIFRL